MPIFLRLFIVVALLVLGASFALFLYTGEQRFLNFFRRALKFIFVFFVVAAGLYLLERVIML